MKRILILAFFITPLFLFAQAPQKMSFQAVVRNNSNQLIINSTIGVRVSLIHMSITGNPLYIETHSVMTNENGLVTLEIGGGSVVLGNISTINWANGPYFIKTEIDPLGTTNYSVVAISQLLSVPYALHANTAGSLLVPPNESDPIFSQSVAAGITTANISYWNQKQDPLTPGTGISIIGNVISATGGGSGIEIDPVFAASIAAGITGADTAFWNQKQDPLVAGSGISIVGNVISSSVNASSHYLGEFYQGGVIFYLWRDSLGVEHGLIASIVDQSTFCQWGFLNIYLGNASSSWDGYANTQAIINAGAQPGTAAHLCWNYSYGGYSDWYLPAADELNLLYANRFHVNKSLSGIPGATEISFQNYWASSEYTASTVAIIYFYGGTAIWGNHKNQNYYVRAIRKF